MSNGLYLFYHLFPIKTGHLLKSYKTCSLKPTSSYYHISFINMFYKEANAHVIQDVVNT